MIHRSRVQLRTVLLHPAFSVFFPRPLPTLMLGYFRTHFFFFQITWAFPTRARKSEMGLVLMRHWLRRLQEVVASEQWPPHLYGVAQQSITKALWSVYCPGGTVVLL